MTTHKHKAVTTSTRRFTGPINSADENRAAHGNVRRVERCACGAERHANVNGIHVEQGKWFKDDDRAAHG